MKHFLKLTTVASLVLAGCTREKSGTELPSVDAPANRGTKIERISLLATNDIHGGLDATYEKQDGPLGGLPFWAGVVQAIRAGRGEREEVYLLDGGDQFQGTLLSNKNEGELLTRLMVAIGYDAVVPGNHDYDFGPEGWLKDQIEEGEAPEKSKEVITKLSALAKPRFPFLSANTYEIASLRDPAGRPFAPHTIQQAKCLPPAGSQVDWKSPELKTPGFLGRYTILKSKRIQARVAVIGLDNLQTPIQTTPPNVADLCFRDPYETYVQLREEILAKGEADIFVIVLHDGDTDRSRNGSLLAEKLSPPGQPPLVDVIIAGHTHYVHNASPHGIPVIQSGAGGKRFGRVDLYWNPKTKSLERARTQQFAGIRLYHDRCDENVPFCEVRGGNPVYDGQPVTSDEAIAHQIRDARAELNGLDKKIVATVKDPLLRNRINESALGNIFAEGILRLARLKNPDTALAFTNSGGVRADLYPGDVDFETFFQVIPFNNQGVLIGPRKVEEVVTLLQSVIKTCGKFGTLIPAGLRVVFQRKCPEKDGDLDEKATLLKVTLLEKDGGRRVLFDAEAGGIQGEAQAELLVATNDFIAGGGDGYTQLTAPKKDLIPLGNIREELFALWSQEVPIWSKQNADGRWLALPRGE